MCRSSYSDSGRRNIADLEGRYTAIANVDIMGGDWSAQIGEKRLDTCMLFSLLPISSSRGSLGFGSHIDSLLRLKLLLINAWSVNNKTLLIHDLTLDVHAEHIWSGPKGSLILHTWPVRSTGEGLL